MRSLLGLASATLVVAVVGGGYWDVACPCGGVPGFVLRGAVHHKMVQDWRFANDVALCQIQVNVGWRPTKRPAFASTASCTPSC